MNPVSDQTELKQPKHFITKTAIETYTYTSKCHFDVAVGINTSGDCLTEQREVGACYNGQLTHLVAINTI